MQIDDVHSGHAWDDDQTATGGFATGTELCAASFEQKHIWNQRYRLEKQRGKPKVICETNDERVLHHKSPRGRHMTEERQRRDENGQWQAVSIRPVAEPKASAKAVRNKRALSVMGFAETPSVVRPQKSETCEFALPVVLGCQRNYADRATALGFSSKRTLDWLGGDGAVLITWLYDARLIGKETKKRLSRVRYMHDLLSKVAAVFPNSVFWLFGGDEVVVRESSSEFDLFMKDVRLGHAWSGSKDAGRFAKQRAARAPLPRDLQAKINKTKKSGSTPKWLVPHGHFVLVVFDAEGCVLPSQQVLEALSTIPVARHQTRSERVGDKGAYEASRTMGQHALSIVEYTIKDSRLGTQQKIQQEKWRAETPNSGLVDIVIDTRDSNKSGPKKSPKLDAVVDEFLRMRSSAYRTSGIQNHHLPTAVRVEEAVRFLARPTRLVSNNSITRFMVQAALKSMTFVKRFWRALLFKNGPANAIRNHGNDSDPP